MVAFLVLMVSTSSLAQVAGVDYQWKEKHHENGIQIYTSKVAGSKHKALRAVMTVKGKLNSLVALVQDNEACPKWADLCKESRIHEKVSDTENYIYSYNNLPFPVSDRDVLAHVIWQQNPISKKVSMTSIASKGRLAKTKAVRIENAVSNWHFTPQGDGNVLVESFAHIDPNGPTPAWLSNMLLVKSPIKTMQNMRRIIEQGDYADAKASFTVIE